MDTNQTESRLFIGLSLPPKATALISQRLIRFRSSISKTVPEEKWHVTLQFLGPKSFSDTQQQTLLTPLVLPFLPAITITHIGRGLSKGQLWAYCSLTYPVKTLHDLVVTRLEAVDIEVSSPTQAFVPHIHIADIKGEINDSFLPDEVASITFVPHQAFLYESTLRPEGSVYSVIGTIPLTAY